MLKRLAVLLFIGISVISFGTDRSVEVGMILPNIKDPFFQEMMLGAKEGAQGKGVSLEVTSAEDSPVRELDEIKRFIDEGVDIVIIAPTNSHAVGRGVNLCNEARIPVITLDRESVKGDVISHIGTNQLRGGEIVARLLTAELEREAKIVELEGKGNTTTSIGRGRGFNQRGSGYFNVIVREDVGFDREKSYETMKRILREEPVIDGVFAHNDESALGALRAIKESRRRIAVVGFDGIQEAVDAVEKGELLGTIDQNPYKMGYMGVETAIKVAAKKWVNRRIDIGLRLITREGDN